MNRIFIVMFMICGFVSVQKARAEVEDGPSAEKKIAVIATEYTARSHANALATKFFTGYPTDEGTIQPKVKVVSFYVDQSAPDDVVHELADKFGIKVYPTITGALTLGGKKLAVDGVIYIGVHGKYPRSRLDAKMYPHLRHMDEIFTVFDSSNRSVPVYCDKELGYSWLDTKWIYERSRELDVPMMAGSTLPLVWRNPPAEHPMGAKIAEAVSVGYGPLNSYVLHMVEIIQSMIERRQGGESGVASVQCLQGEAVYEAAEQGKFSMELAEAACATIEAKKQGSMREHEENPLAVIITYRDGTRATAISCSGYIGEHFAYAANADGRTLATQFVLPHSTIFPHFSYLWLNVEKMILTGKPQWPIERNVLANGIIDTALRSLADGGKMIQTPFLDIQYQAPDPQPIRPSRPEPAGQSLGPWPPKGFEFTDWE